MPANPEKRRCAMPGCRAWARHGETLCASHLRSDAVRRHSRQVLPLLRAAAVPPASAPGPSDAQGRDAGGGVEVIDRELEQLLEARRYFRSWVEEQRRREERGESSEDGPRALTPAQFMQAWNGTTTRVIQLVKARSALLGAGANAADALLQEVLDEVARGLPGDPPCEPPPDAGAGGGDGATVTPSEGDDGELR